MAGLLVTAVFSLGSPPEGDVLLSTAYFGDVASKGDHNERAYWAYNETAKWPTLATSYLACRGTKQSPINIDQVELAGPFPSLDFSFPEKKGTFYNNGNFLQMEFDQKNSVTVAQGNASSSFTLWHAEMHSPSEHAIGGKTLDMELSFHFKSADGGKIAVAVLLEKSTEPNAFLAHFLDQPPPKKAAPGTPGGGYFTVQLDPEEAFPDENRNYYTYDGSLTHPPCTEGVKWFIFVDTQTISEAQLKMWRKQFKKSTARPLQELNGRVVGLDIVA